MKYLDNVDSEGGPFLIADAEVARDWRGTEDDGSNYDRACRVFLANPELPGSLLTIGSEQALVWETGGPGTGDVFISQEGSVIIIRAWLDEPTEADTDDEMKTVTALVLLPFNEPIELGTLEIASGVLAILWSPESGECIEPSDIELLKMNECTRPSGEMSSDSSGLLVRLAAGSYTSFHDEVELGEASARRCHLIKQ